MIGVADAFLSAANETEASSRDRCSIEERNPDMLPTVEWRTASGGAADSRAVP